MNLGFHRLTVNQFDRDKQGRMKILLDGKEVLCRNYKIEQSYETIPVIELELAGYGGFDGDVGVNINDTNIDFLCQNLNRKQVELFIKFWNTYHDEKIVFEEKHGV